MKFQINSSTLKNILGLLAKIPYSNSNPIKSAFFIQVEENKLTVYVSDEVIAIEKTIQNTEIQVEKPGKIIVNAYILNELIQKLDGLIKLQTTDDKTLNLESEHSKARLNLLDSEHWKDIQKHQNGQEITLSTNNLKQIQNQVAFAAQGREGRVVFQGVNLRVVDKKLIATATDGSRIARKLLSATDYDLDIILPLRTVLETNRIVSESKAKTLKAQITEDQIVFMIDENTTLTSYLIHETFPDTEPQLVRVASAKVVCETRKILEAIERTSIVFDKQSLPRTILKIQNKTLCVSSPEENEVGHFQEQLIPLEITGSEQSISLQSKFLLSVLRTIDDDKVILEFTAEEGPLKIQAESHSSLIHLLMPFWSY